MANIEIIVKKLIDIHIKGVDSYVNNGSLWLIFTEEKKWVIELTKDGILWYNYSFFSKIFRLISMNVVDNQHYITRWVEDALQNGVKDTRISRFNSLHPVEDALQNGVKDTISQYQHHHRGVENTLQNGVKRTWMLSLDNSSKVENTIQNGVKQTKLYNMNLDVQVEETLQNGVKETYDASRWQKGLVEDIIQNGVKETLSNFISSDVCVEDIIQNGVKEVKGLPDMSGELRGYGDYYRSQKTMAKPHSLYVKDVIENSIKEKL